MTPQDALAAIKDVSVAGYWPRVSFKGDVDHAECALVLKLIARPIDERLVRQLEEAVDKGFGRVDFLIPPDGPLTKSSTRIMRVEVTKVLFSHRLGLDELRGMSRDVFVSQVLGKMLKDFAEHEVEEFFRYQGRRVFNPHPEVPGYQDLK